MNQPDISEQIRQLQEKSNGMGQSLPDFLQGVLYARHDNYWDYLNLEALLSLQRPKTDFPDEMVFVTYHQACELYFKLILWEMQQLCELKEAKTAYFIEKIQRVIRYYENLVFSFDIVAKGLDQAQFAKFRLSLFPASGFQSVQYRLMEFYCTDLHNLVSSEEKEQVKKTDKIPALYKKLYWQNTNGHPKENNKNLSSRHFQQKYQRCLLQKAREMQHTNINRIYAKYFADSPDRELVGAHLKKLDVVANIKWRLAHFKVVARHLQRKGIEKGTGNVHWKKYLPPHYQKIIYFPDFWTAEEKEHWGLHFAMQAMGHEEPLHDHSTLDII
ncbi:MAG TPA: tryptophan 2,3-dioxygenase family protein [Chitinophagaceae bacterium]|nr:tryptophan 2,3-dioxygenase family protein [Chitinophagaceae bacterium]